MSLIICPEGCNTVVPAAQFDPCSPQINNGQVTRIYMTNVGYPLTDWTDPAEWANRISNTSTSPDAIRELVVIGDKPQPESQEKLISDNRRYYGNKLHTLNFRIDETNAANHEFLRGQECGGAKLIWYADSNGKLFGGPLTGTEGIEVSIIGDMIIPESRDEIRTYNYTAKWESKFTENEIVSPIA